MSHAHLMTKRTNGAAPAAPRRSGSNLSDARRAELGYGRITLRLPIDTLAILEAEAEASGLSRTELVDSAIRLHCDPKESDDD